MREAKILVPDRYNDGSPVMDSFRVEFETALVKRFQGFTKHQASGAWAGPNGVQVEPITVYTVACSESRAVRAMAEFVKAELRQEAVYIVRSRGDVQFV